MSEQIFNDTSPTNKNQIKEKEQSDNEEENNLLPFLSKDLFNQINSIDEVENDEIDFPEDKFTNTILKENDKHNVQEELDDADLIHEENEYEMDFNNFKKEKNEKNKINNINNNSIKFSKENYHENETQETDSMPRVLSEKLAQPNFNQKKFSIPEKRNSALNLGSYGDEKMIKNNSNNMLNNINFMNNSFSKNGKTGWICSVCQNFNYESKNLLFF